jgi:hypothetical protein
MLRVAWNKEKIMKFKYLKLISTYVEVEVNSEGYVFYHDMIDVEAYGQVGSKYQAAFNVGDLRQKFITVPRAGDIACVVIDPSNIWRIKFEMIDHYDDLGTGKDAMATVEFELLEVLDKNETD